MKKMTMVLMLIGLAVLASRSEAIQIGIGYTFDTGLHFRVGKFEGQAIFGEANLLGARLYALEKPLTIKNRVLNFYTGLEANLVKSNLLDGGYVAGAFGGLDKAIYKKLHLNLDLGIYTASLNGFETVSDLGVAINTKLTWYFGK